MLAVAAVALAVSLGGPAPQTDVELGVDVPDVEAIQKIPAQLKYNDAGPWVELLNHKLREAGFNSDEGNAFKRQTRHSVYAFQKHHDLKRDGVFTADMWNLLEQRIVLPYRPETNRVEVNLKKQVLYLVEEGEVQLVLPISSGNGAAYTNLTGGRSIARTPEGKFNFQYHIPGNRESYLGILWNPYYFWNGYAIHGSPSVPNRPASHGCIRTTFWDMRVLMNRLEIGQTLYVYGKRKAIPEITIASPPIEMI